MPSTDVTRSGAASATVVGGATGTGFFLLAAWLTGTSNAKENNAAASMGRRMVNDIPLLPLEIRPVVRGLIVSTGVRGRHLVYL